MKKIVSVLMILVLLIPSFAVLSLAEDPVHLSISDETVYAGDEFTISLFISDNSKVSGAVIDIAYDKDFFEFISAKEGAILDADANISIKNINGEKPCVRFTYLSPSSSVTSAGVLFSVTFLAKETAEGETELKISVPNSGDFISSDLVKIAYSVKNSKVIIIKNDTLIENVTEEESSEEKASESTSHETILNDVESDTTVSIPDHKDNKIDVIIISVILVVGLLLIIIGFVFLFRKKK